MARSGCSLSQAATELGVALSHEEAGKILRRPTFQSMLWEARHRYFSQLGGDPNFSKDTAIGQMLDQARKLDEEGLHDKAAEVLFKIAKMNNWVGPESQVNVFGELSDADLKAIREKISQPSVSTKRLN